MKCGMSLNPYYSSHSNKSLTLASLNNLITNPQQMQSISGKLTLNRKKALSFLCLLFFLCLSGIHAQGQPPIKDPSNPENPQLPPTQYDPGRLYDVLKDKNGDNNGKSIGKDNNKGLKERLQKDSLVKENTPQSINKTEDTYGMNLFRGGVV